MNKWFLVKKQTNKQKTALSEVKIVCQNWGKAETVFVLSHWQNVFREVMAAVLP